MKPTLISKNLNVNSDGEYKQTKLEFLDSTSKMFLLMMQNHFRGASLWMNNILVPFMVTFSLSIILPIWYSFIWVLFINLTFTAFMTYGGLFFTVKKSTIMNNLVMTSSREASLYVSTFISILCTSLITLFVSFITLMFSYYIGTASLQFFYNLSNPTGVKYISWLNIWWDMLFYYWFTSAVASFSISFVIEKISSTQKTFFIVSFIYLLGGLFFAGVMASNIILIDGVPRVITTKNHSQIPDGTQGVFPSYYWGKPAWIISQFWPHFGLNQFAFHTLESGSYTKIESVTDRGKEIVEVASSWKNITMQGQLEDPRIIYYVAMPWIYSGFGYWTGGLISRYNLKNY